MRPNAVKQLFRQAKPALCAWCSIGNPYSAETLGHAGFDAVVIDLQHGMIFLDQAMPMLSAISSTPATPLVRISENQFFEANKMLDAGAYGIICPMIDDVASAQRFVSACRYPPAGRRSFGPTRGLLYGGADYFEHANDEILTLGMIETPQGLENLDRIAAVDGLDGIFIGPSDLSLALGAPPLPDWTRDPLRSAIDRILETTRNHGKMAGIFCINLAFGLAMKAKGFDLINVSNDAAMLRTTGAGWVGELRGA
jgi:4-hydroxy-2-oxoheptanedioate aldolase